MDTLDYMVFLASDVIIRTYDGNMAKIMEGHHRMDWIHLVELIDQYNSCFL